MDKAEFDHVADEYAAMHARNIALSGEGPEYFARYKIEDAAQEAAQHGIDVRRVLDFGSGIGNSLPHFADLFPRASLTCADVSSRSLAISQSRFPAIAAEHVEIDGDRLPLQDESVDLAFSACVFHHIPHKEHVAWLRELRRVTRRGGLLMIFEHNPLNPLTVATVRNCPFDENAVLVRAGVFQRSLEMAGWSQPSARYRIFFPGSMAFARPLERWLRRVPLGAQYFVAARRD